MLLDTTLVLVLRPFKTSLFGGLGLWNNMSGRGLVLALYSMVLTTSVISVCLYICLVCLYYCVFILLQHLPAVNKDLCVISLSNVCNFCHPPPGW